MDRSVGSPRTRSVVGVRGPGVSVFGLPCTCQLDTAVVVQEQLQSQVLVQVNSFVAINSFPCRLLVVKKKLFVESSQIVLANIN